MWGSTSLFFFALAAIIWGRVLLDHFHGGFQRFPSVVEMLIALGLDYSPPWQWAAELTRVTGQLDAGVGALAVSLIALFVDMATRSER